MRGMGSLSYLALVCGKGGENLSLLSFGNADEVKRAPKLSRHFIEFIGGDLEFAVGFLQAEWCRTWLRACILERSARNVADPQSPHEFQPWQSAELLGVPLL